MATALVLMVSSRVGDEINYQSAWTIGIEVLVIVAVPAVVWWSDLLYRSVVVVWTLWS